MGWNWDGNNGVEDRDGCEDWCKRLGKQVESLVETWEERTRRSDFGGKVIGCIIYWNLNWLFILSYHFEFSNSPIIYFEKLEPCDYWIT